MNVFKLVFVFVIINYIQISYAVLNDTQFAVRLIPEIPTFADIAEKCGRSCEEFEVTTEDGYILKIFHILGNSSKPVLLMHGMLDSSDGCIIRETDSLALTLAAEGYDVWSGNNRGNRYSRHNVKLDPDKDKSFWNYTFHEMGYYDLPCIIDFVLEKTGQTKLRAVGYSEGTTIFYVMGATRPEYNDKIHVTACLAPVAYLHNAKGLWPLLIKVTPELNLILELANYEEVLGFKSDEKSFISLICNIKDIGYDFCIKAVGFSFSGDDSAQLEPEFLPTFFKYFPSGTSRKNLIHFLQVGYTKTFAKYDYGPVKNMLQYSSVTPPIYDLNKVTMNIGLYLGANDYASTIVDVELLKRQLPNVVEYKVIDYSLWNHVDHVVGKYMPEYLFPHILDLFSKYN